jgi:hypothetical protein
MFIEGRQYTRDQIHEVLGGSKEAYLPHRDGVILCACIDPAKNPEAPAIVLPGTGRDIERTADLLRRQGGSIPVFLKDAVNAWRYVGEWEVEARSCTREDIEDHQARTGRDDITRVIWLRPADPLHPARTIAEVTAVAAKFRLQVQGLPAARRVFRSARAWVRTEGVFAPATWAAYRDIGAEPYIQALQGRLRGFQLSEEYAIEILERLGLQFERNDGLFASLAAWASAVEPQALDGRQPDSFRFAKVVSTPRR